MNRVMTGHRIVIAAFESAQVLDVTWPLEVFSTASRFWPAADYHAKVVSSRGGPVGTSSGLALVTGPVGGRGASTARVDADGVGPAVLGNGDLLPGGLPGRLPRRSRTAPAW